MLSCSVVSNADYCRRHRSDAILKLHRRHQMVKIVSRNPMCHTWPTL